MLWEKSNMRASPPPFCDSRRQELTLGLYPEQQFLLAILQNPTFGLNLASTAETFLVLRSYTQSVDTAPRFAFLRSARCRGLLHQQESPHIMTSFQKNVTTSKRKDKSQPPSPIAIIGQAPLSSRSPSSSPPVYRYRLAKAPDLQLVHP